MRGEQFAQAAGAGLTKLRRSSYGTASRRGQHPVYPHAAPGGICISQTWWSSSRTHVLTCVRTCRGGGGWGGVFYVLKYRRRHQSHEGRAWPSAGCAPSSPRGAVRGGGSSPAPPEEAQKRIGAWCDAPAPTLFPQSQERPGETVEAGPLTTNKQKDVVGWVFSRSSSVF